MSKVEKKEMAFVWFLWVLLSSSKRQKNVSGLPVRLTQPLPSLLTCHCWRKNCGTWLWGRGHSRYPIGRGRTPDVGCGVLCLVKQVPDPDWPGNQGDFVLERSHSRHQSCRKTKRESQNVKQLLQSLCSVFSCWKEHFIFKEDGSHGS